MPEKLTLAKAKREFLADLRAEDAWRKAKLEDGRFYDGDQWTSEQKATLESRGQPAIVINRIKPKIDAICGTQQALRVDTKAYPLGNREAEAEEISNQLRLIEDCCNFDEQESTAFEDVVIDGRSYYLMSKYLKDGIGLCKAERIENDDVVRDRRGKRVDLSDSRHVHYTVKSSLGDLKALFPKKAQEIEDATLDPHFMDAADREMSRVRPDQYADDKAPAHTETFDTEDFEQFVDKENRQVRVVTTYYRDTEVKRLFRHAGLAATTPDGSDTVDVTKFSQKDLDTFEISFPNAEVIVQTRRTLNSITFTWNVELEHLEDIREYDQQAKFPIVCVDGYIERATGQPYGLVRQMKDPQREVNSRRSKMLHLLNSKRITFNKGAFLDPSAARAELNRPDAFQEIQGNFQVNVQENTDLSQAQYQLLNEAKSEIDNAGVQTIVEGGGRATSGREFQLRQQQAMQGIRKLFANLREARRRVAMWCLDEILRDHPELGTAKYDILIEESPESLNLTSETFGQLVSLAQSGLPIPPEMLIEVSPLPQKQKAQFLEKMQAMQQMQAAQGQVPGAQGPGQAAG